MSTARRCLSAAGGRTGTIWEMGLSRRAFLSSLRVQFTDPCYVSEALEMGMDLERGGSATGSTFTCLLDLPGDLSALGLFKDLLSNTNRIGRDLHQLVILDELERGFQRQLS